MSEREVPKLPELWLASADTDIGMAQLGLREGLNDPACFHCQQAAEKALKGYLLARGQGFIRTHSLQRLLRECMTFDETLGILDKACSTLTVFYTAARYPDTLEALETCDRGTTEDAVLKARQVVDTVRAAIARLETSRGHTDES